MDFPVTRLRRLRRTEAMRSLVREVHLRPEAFIYPLFVCPGEGIRREISSMPGVFNLSVDEAAKEVEEAARLGLGGLLLFGLPAVVNGANSRVKAISDAITEMGAQSDAAVDDAGRKARRLWLCDGDVSRASSAGRNDGQVAT